MAPLGSVASPSYAGGGAGDTVSQPKEVITELDQVFAHQTALTFNQTTKQDQQSVSHPLFGERVGQFNMTSFMNP